MVEIMCGVSLKETQPQPSTELRRCLGLETIGDAMRRCRLKWHGHVESMNDADYVKPRRSPGRTLRLSTCIH